MHRCWLIALAALASGCAARVRRATPPPASAVPRVKREVLFAEDFERPDASGTLPKGWVPYSDAGAVGLSTEQAHSGRHSLKLVDDDPANAVGLRTAHVKAPDSEYCWVSWWHHGEKGTSQSMYLEFWTADGKRPQALVRSWGARGQGKWTHFVRRARIPSGAATVTLLAYSWSKGRSEGYYDDIQFGTSETFYDRTPQPPAAVTHPCGLYKQADVERAKRNIEKHEWARNVFEGLKRSAKFWMDCPDDKLPYWIPDLTPFRVVDCPKCGAGWRFAWTPVGYEQIKCRNCGFTWPHPDYPEEDVQTFPDPIGGQQKIPYHKGKPSTVYGSAKSRIFRLSGRLRYHRVGRLASLGNVGKVYALTGDVEYARTVRKVLLRLAEVYPHYMPHDWRRVFEDYSNLQSGKLSGWKLHDANTFIELATAYDLTYGSGVYSREDKVKIEEGCFREFARLMTETSPRGCCINDGPFAMGAGALAGLVLGDHKVIAWAIEPPDGFIGFLRDYFLRDGHWYEASPSYEGMSLGRLYVAPEALRGYSDPPSYTAADRYDKLDLFEHPLMKKILVAGAAERMPDGNLPPTNDSTFGARYPRRRAEANCFWYPTERNTRLMAWAFGGKAAESGDEYSLFRRDPDLDFSKVEPLAPSSRSVVSPGAGYAILRTGDGPADAALVLDYGPHGSGHGHPDRLNILYYDFGKELVTDLGYLGAGHPNHPWIRSTASHNQVIVDGKPQARHGGELEAFCGTGSVQAVIASAPTAYKGIVETYRRYVLLADHGPGKRYVVDLFEVKGGTDHQYAFHADGSQFAPPDLEFEAADAKTLGQPATGYRWLQEVKQAEAPGPFVCQWLSDEKAGLGVRLHMMGAPRTRLYCAKANGLRNRKTPFAKVDMFQVYVQRPGPANMFLSVIQAFKGASGLEARELTAKAERGQARAVEVKVGGLTDIVVIADEEAAAGTIAIAEHPAVRFSGRMGHVSLKGKAVAGLWMLGGRSIRYGDTRLAGTPKHEGRIVAVDHESCSVTVDCALEPGTAWAGQHLLVRGRSDGAYRIAEVGRPRGKTVIRLAGEPILTLKPGDRFAIRRSSYRTNGSVAP